MAYALGWAWSQFQAGEASSIDRTADHDLGYGQNTVEIHADAMRPGERAVIIDDVLATGGTAAAAAELGVP